MRILICLLICTIGCRAQRPEDDVLAVFKQMEKAEQSGDANALIGLWSRETVANIEKMRAYIRPNPSARYTASKIYVQGDQAALVGQTGQAQFLSMTLVKEDGRWKVKDQVWSDKAFPLDSVYALVPPANGAFESAGEPWQNVAPAFNEAEAAKRDWQVRATYDGAYLYVRIESPTPFPPPGSTASRPPSGWPVMKIATSGAGEFVLYPSADIGDQATFDKTGHADSHRPFVAYSARLERGGQPIFQASSALHPDPLVQVGLHFFEVRIPLRTMGISDASRMQFTIGDAQWPKSAVFSVQAQQYR